MKNLAARILTLAFTVALIFGSTVLAQRIPQVIKANIPFDFTVNDHAYAAGTYFLASQAPVFLELRDKEGRTLATVLTNSVETVKTPSSPKLLFYTEDGRFSLAQVWQQNYSIGQQLQPSKSLEKVAKKHPGGTVTVAASNVR
jgi:hypothetical protein